MKIFISAKPNAREERVEKLDDTHFHVWVKEPPLNGRANAAIIELLASYFGVAKSSVRIVQGSFQKKKVMDIL